MKERGRGFIPAWMVTPPGGLIKELNVIPTMGTKSAFLFRSQPNQTNPTKTLTKSLFVSIKLYLYKVNCLPLSCVFPDVMMATRLRERDKKNVHLTEITVN